MQIQSLLGRIVRCLLVSASSLIPPAGFAADFVAPAVLNASPRVDLVRPIRGELFLSPASIQIEAQVVDSDGYADFVEFFANERKIGESRFVFDQAPQPGSVLTHDFNWKEVPDGEYQLVAVAYDDLGASAKSLPMAVKVFPGPILPIVNVVASDPEAHEPPTPLPNQRIAINRGQFTFTRTGTKDQDLRVYFHLAGTAINGLDYPAIPGAIVIPAGSDSATIDILPINDQSIEITETVIAQLSLPPIAIPFDSEITPDPKPSDPTLPGTTARPPYLLGERISASIDILDNGEGQDDGVPEINIKTSDAEATEPPTDAPNVKIRIDEGRFTLTRTGSTLTALSVYFRLSGSARNGTDYQMIPFTATIPAGADFVDILVFPIFDQFIEGDESVIVTVINWPFLEPPIRVEENGDPIQGQPTVPRPRYKIRAQSEAKLLIHDHLEEPENRPPKADIVKPAAGEAFPVGRTILVEVQTADADGYVPYVELFAGKERIGESRIDFIHQPDPGTLLTHTFEWKVVAPGDYTLYAIAHDDGGALTTTAPISIHVEPRLVRTVVTVKAMDDQASEPNSIVPGAGRAILFDPAVFTIHREGDLSIPIQVFFHPEGTAQNGVDYEKLPTQIEIPKGEANVDVTIVPIDDALAEGEETVALVLDPPACLAVAKPMPACYVVAEPGAARAIIKDTDSINTSAPVLTLSTFDAIATERQSQWASPTATFVLRRTGSTTEPLKVNLKVGGTATPDKDYKPFPETVTIPVGARSLRLTLIAVDDKEKEEIETVLVGILPADETSTAGNNPAYRLGRPSRAAAVILDDDRSRPMCQELAGGFFHLCLADSTLKTFRLEMSLDLQQWSSLGLVTASDGAIHYVDPDGDTAKMKFYRVVSAEGELLE